VTRPLVSISVPSFNYARFLPAAIESALSQTYPNVEIIVIDDGSEDGSLEIARGYAARYPSVKVVTHPNHENRGPGATANLGRSQARGEYWCGLASDDVYRPTKIERQVDVLESDHSLAFVYGRARLVDAEGAPLRGGELPAVDLSREPHPLEHLLAANVVPATAALVRKTTLDEVPEDESLAYSDWDLWIGLAALGGVAFIDEVVVDYRVHGENMSLGVERGEEVERQLAVLLAVRKRSAGADGALAAPRTQAVLELRLAHLLFCAGERTPAQQALEQAFAKDPSLAHDLGRVQGWLESAQLGPLNPPVDPAKHAAAATALRRGARAGGQEDVFGLWVLEHLPGEAASLAGPLASAAVPVQLRLAVRGYTASGQRVALIRAGLAYLAQQAARRGVRSLLRGMGRALKRRRALSPVEGPAAKG
jgi:hypothetical protein